MDSDKKENKIFLIWKEIQRDRVQSHIWLSITVMASYGEIFEHFLIYKGALPYIWLCTRFQLNFLWYEEDFVSFFHKCKNRKCLERSAFIWYPNWADYANVFVYYLCLIDIAPLLQCCTLEKYIEVLWKKTARNQVTQKIVRYECVPVT